MGSYVRVRLEVRLLGDQMNKICFGPVSEHRLQREGCSTPALWRSTLPVCRDSGSFSSQLGSAMKLCVSTSLLCLLLFGTPIIGGTVQTSDKTLPERVPRIIADRDVVVSRAH